MHDLGGLHTKGGCWLVVVVGTSVYGAHWFIEPASRYNPQLS